MKALEILKKRKLTLMLIKASSVLTKKESIEIDEDIKELEEAIAELEVLQTPKTCDGCKWDAEAKHIDTHPYCLDCIRGEHGDFYEPKGSE